MRSTHRPPEEVAAVRGALLASVPIGIALIDADGQIVESNPAMDGLLRLGAEPRALRELAQRVAERIPGRATAERDLPWHRALKGECVRSRDLRVSQPSAPEQTRIIAISARPLRRANRRAPGVLILAMDRVQLLARHSEQPVLPRYLRNVLTRVCQGRTTEEISAELHVTLATTRMYIKRLLLRLGAHSRAELILRAMELGLYPFQR